jgi:glutamate/tyrosine decarboxylase-like PLP-dependent enzyme
MVWHPPGRDDEARQLLDDVVAAVRSRLDDEQPDLGRALTYDQLRSALGTSITASGLGGPEALRRFVDVLAPSCLTIDHPLYLAYVPAAPSHASTLADVLVSVWNMYPGTFADGSGAVYAENEALEWLAALAGMPVGAGGVFVSGGTAGNLSALIAARHRWRERANGAFDRTRGIVVTSDGAHASVEAAARVMDADVVAIPADHRGRLDRSALVRAVDQLGPSRRSRVFAVVATAGTTNAGVVDDLAAAADVAADLGTWLHIDGAYGGAALLSAGVRHHFAGIERADSLIIDPHKWLFAPFDCCALVYLDPATARDAHTQHAAYLEPTQWRAEWNPSDFAHHLTRRARGLPFWFGLAVYGTDAYAAAVEANLRSARHAAALITASSHLELVMDPELSVVLLRRVGWDAHHYREWSERIAAAGIGYVTPTVWRGETVARLCFVNPATHDDDIRWLLDSMSA